MRWTPRAAPLSSRFATCARDWETSPGHRRRSPVGWFGRDGAGFGHSVDGIVQGLVEQFEAFLHTLDGQCRGEHAAKCEGNRPVPEQGQQVTADAKGDVNIATPAVRRVRAAERKARACRCWPQRSNTWAGGRLACVSRR